MTNIFVAKLDYSVTQDELKNAFGHYGNVVKVSVATDKETGKSKGFAFIEMSNADEASAAIKGLDGSTLKGRQISVKEAENRPKREFKPNDRPQNNYNSDSKKTNSDFPKKESVKESDDFEPIIPIIEKPKKEIKPKEFNTKKIDDRPKSFKMPAYKKSGKQKNNFYLDDEDDDLY
jgi:RNA recognition motif-containing protein